MSEDDNISLVYAIGALVLVVSALFSRRLGFAELFRSLLYWVAIFAVFIVAFSFRDEFSAVWQRVSAEMTGSSAQKVVGSSLVIKRSDDGHYWVDAMMNGEPTRFLIDSGATTTGISLRSAKAANVEIDTSGFPVVLSTANGTLEAQRGLVSKLQIGPISATALHVTVADEFGDTNVIGMNFLSQLRSWRVEGDKMILEP